MSNVDNSTQTRRAERPVTVKLPADEVDLLQALALLAETTLAQQIRNGIEQYLEQRLTQPDLPEKITSAQKRHASTLGQLLTPNKQPTVPLPEPPTPARRPVRQRSITLRIPNRECDLMTALGILDDTSLADQLRTAVSDYLTQQLTDQTVNEQITGIQQEHERLLNAAV